MIMYIRKSKTRRAKGVNYYSYRIVECIRDSNNKIKQRTLLNLGSQYKTIPESDHILLSERVEGIINGQGELLSLSDELESEAQRIANLIIKKHSYPVSGNSRQKDTRYETIDVNGIENSEVRTIGCEHLSYETAKRIGLLETLDECKLSEKEKQDALGIIIGRLI